MINEFSEQQRCNECYWRKSEQSQQPIGWKESITSSQWERKVKTNKPPKARENASDQIAIGFIFECDWLRGWFEISVPITWQSKQNQVNATLIENCSNVTQDFELTPLMFTFVLCSVVLALCPDLMYWKWSRHLATRQITLYGMTWFPTWVMSEQFSSTQTVTLASRRFVPNFMNQSAPNLVGIQSKERVSLFFPLFFCYFRKYFSFSRVTMDPIKQRARWCVDESVGDVLVVCQWSTVSFDAFFFCFILNPETQPLAWKNETKQYHSLSLLFNFRSPWCPPQRFDYWTFG